MRRKRTTLVQIKKYLDRLPTSLRFLQIFLFCGLTVLLFLTILISTVINPLLQKQAATAARSTFQRAEADMTVAQQTAKNLGVQLLLDQSCSYLLNASEPNADTVAMNTGIKQVRLLSNTNRNVHSIYIINNKAGMIFPSTYSIFDDGAADFPDQDILEWIQDPMHARKLIKRYSIPDTLAFKKAQNVYTFMVPNRYVDGYLQSCVVINISLESLTEQLASYYEFQNDTYLRISDERDTLVELCSIDTKETERFLTWSEKTHEKNISDQNKFIEGTTYTLINHHSPSTGLYFTLVQPQNIALASMNQIRNIFLIIMLAGVLLELLLSLVGSKYIQKLFYAIEQERHTLAQSVSSTADALQEKFWRGYLTGTIRYSNPDFAGILKKHQITNMGTGSLCILKIELPEDVQTPLTLRENMYIRQLFLESFSEAKPVFLFRQKTLFSFLLFPKAQNGLERLPIIPESFSREIPYSFSLIGNRRISRMGDYPDVWNELAMSAKLSFFYPPNTYLDSGKMNAEHQDASNCSNLTIAQQIAFAMVDANLERAQNLFLQFEKTLQHKTYECYFNHIVWLAMSITNSAASSWLRIAKGNEPNTLFQDFAREIANCTNRQQAIEQFLEFLAQLGSAVADTGKVSSASVKAEQVRAYIEKNYADQSITINSIAEKLSLSPDYLRKVFKSVYGQSLSEYISQFRLQAAANDLEHTNKTLKEVAETCGFSSVNYFCTSFKKTYGLTPTQYRSARCDKL